MTPDDQAQELLNRTADESLLDADPAKLPVAIGRPPALPASRTRARLVGVGATLTGLTLVTGVLLLVLGVIVALSSGVGPSDGAALGLGAVLAGTHWGWVHVAEASSDAIERRRNRDTLALRREWLETIEPYTRYEVTTRVADDGSITIDRISHSPTLSRAHGFTFVRSVQSSELHSGDEPAADIAERAEMLRRQASLDTERERRRFEAVADARQGELLGRGDRQEELTARRAASEALSEQINSNLRDPPLME